MERLVLFDDLDPDKLADESIPFAIDEVVYRLDLTRANAATFRELIAPYLAGAKKVGKQRLGRGTSRPTAAPLKQQPQSTAAKTPKRKPARPRAAAKVSASNGSKVRAPAFSGATPDRHDPDYLSHARAWLRIQHEKVPPRLSNAMLDEYDEHCAANGTAR